MFFFFPTWKLARRGMYCFPHSSHCYAFWPEPLRVSNRKIDMPATLGDMRVSFVIGIMWKIGCHKCEHQLHS